MSPTPLLLENFNRTIDTWVIALGQYAESDLTLKPEQGWSMGQLYMHLVTDTEFYLEQISKCLCTRENSELEPTEFGKLLFANNGFPDAVIPGAPSNDLLPQPANKAQIQHTLQNLKRQYNDLYPRIIAIAPHARTKHPGLGYLNCLQWFQFTEMHFRHHLRQKERIDQIINRSKTKG
ncbi:MAG TPA: DinB family protein [Dyadobacter sp.]|nr:DinB family protein [Dyadobacter sp.]